MNFLTYQDCITIFNNGESTNRSIRKMYEDIAKNGTDVKTVLKIREFFGFSTNVEHVEFLHKKYEQFKYNQEFIGYLK